MTDPDVFMRDLAEAMEELDMDIDEYIRRNSIQAKQIDSYVEDADDHGYIQNDIWKVDQENPFYFIYEWDTYHNGEPPRIYLAKPYETLRFNAVSNDYREAYRENYIY